jgi:methylenetetrahydrofolate/methylenetetrahydromethanopterin dehydrogenase (NADP+)
VWSANRTVELLIDYNAAEPLGVEGIEAGDVLAEREGKLVLGALGVGGKKMKTHKACVRRLFERSDLVLDADGVYAVALEIV